MDILGLIPQFGGLIYTLVAFVVALSVIVAVHEYGHYIVGRWTGIHAEVFSLGFGPVLWSRMDKRGTRWQIAALPFGGYVKFLGDADAASGKDTETMAEIYQRNPDDLRHTMHGAPLWARAATVAAGPFFNFAMSIAIFTVIIMLTGVARDPLTVGKLHPLPDGTFQLAEGDEVLTVAGTPIPEKGDAKAWGNFRTNLPQQPVLQYGIRRNGTTMTVDGPYYYPAYIGLIFPSSAAQDIGLQTGDVIIAIEGTPVIAFDQLKTWVEASEGKPLHLDVWRNGEALKFELVPRRIDEQQVDGGFVSQWRIGIGEGQVFDPATTSVGPLDSLWGGAMSTFGIVKTSLSGLWHMITGSISSCNMSGPIGIAKVSGATASQGAQSFVTFIAFLSTAVGLLNLFPIPALDGGHLVFYAYEAVAGKPPSDKVLRVLMAAGIALILSLMLFALSNDLFC